MKLFTKVLLLIAIAFSMSVSAKAPPGHGMVQEPKMKDVQFCHSDLTVGTSPIRLQVLPQLGAAIYYIEPVRVWAYVDVADPIYHAPYVAAVAAFFARNSC